MGVGGGGTSPLAWCLTVTPLVLSSGFWSSAIWYSFTHRPHVSQPLARSEFTGDCQQVVNRLKIPQGLSTLLFRRWSAVSSRGGVHGDSVSSFQC